MKQFLTLIALLCSLNLVAAEWQWSVEVDGMVSKETNAAPQAFLWIPTDCARVKAVMVGMHNMSEETLFENPLFRDGMSEAGVALIWVTPGLDCQAWDVSKGVQPLFDKMLTDLATVSGYDEIAYCPIVPIGHSAMATYPWNFAAWNPDRTLAIVSLHGDAPRTNLTGYGRENIEWGRTRNIDGIPGLMIEGEYEWWEARVNPALAFRMMYPGSCVSFLCDAGRGHFDVSDATARYIALFVKKAIEYRYPRDFDISKAVTLKKLIPEEGWLAERWRVDERRRAKPAPYARYKGDVHDAFWYFDEDMARLTEARYKETRGKKMQYVSYEQTGRLLPYNTQSHVKISAKFAPHADGVTFNLKPVFVDSLCATYSDEHTDVQPVISRICGPVVKVNDTTFRVQFYRMGMHNPRRTSEICLIAEAAGDKRYKSAVREFSMRIPYRHTSGVVQTIDFPAIGNVGADTEAVRLQAVSDAGLPVYYYVKEGPVELSGDTLTITPIPPRAKYPLKVTVVAWQYGIAGKVQTAVPVERTFYIEK